jgi:hypothetical protein
MIRTLVLFFIFCALVSSAWAFPSVRTLDSVKFEVQGSALTESNGVKYIAIDLVLTNENDTKKIDFDQKIEYTLSDEFDNHYRALPKPGSYQSSVQKTPSNFPSIYPGESCGRTLFFEAPVAKAVKLRLSIKPSVGEMPGSLDIEFPAVAQDPVAPSAIEIVSPENGDVLRAGDTFSLHTKVNASELPYKMIIIAFEETLQDATPSQEDTYNITIPADAPKGQASISVIGYWTDPKTGSQKILSEDVVVYVNPGPPPESL